MNTENIIIASLHHKTHVAELWHGASGSAEDLTGSEIPGGYIEVIRCVVERLYQEKLHPAGEPVNIAAPTSLWVSAALQAKKSGVAIHKIICPFSSMPWKDPALVCIGVGPEQARTYMRNIYRDADYILHPRTAAVYYAVQAHRAALGEATPTVILATESPLHAAKEICEVLCLQEDLRQVITNSRKRFLEY